MKLSGLKFSLWEDFLKKSVLVADLMPSTFSSCASYDILFSRTFFSRKFSNLWAWNFPMSFYYLLYISAVNMIFSFLYLTLMIFIFSFTLHPLDHSSYELICFIKIF
jgi:hypothetical protein